MKTMCISVVMGFVGIWLAGVVERSTTRGVSLQALIESFANARLSKHETDELGWRLILICYFAAMGLLSLKRLHNVYLAMFTEIVITPTQVEVLINTPFGKTRNVTFLDSLQDVQVQVGMFDGGFGLSTIVLMGLDTTDGETKLGPAAFSSEAIDQLIDKVRTSTARKASIRRISLAASDKED